MTQHTSQRGALPRVCTLLGPREQMQLEAATADRLTLLPRRGLRRLRQDGVRLVRAGLTTPEEVLRACGA